MRCLYTSHIWHILDWAKNHECCSHLVTLASWASVHSAPRSHDLFGHIRRLHKPRLTWHFISPCCNAKRSYPEPTWHHTRCRPRDTWITQLEQLIHADQLYVDLSSRQIRVGSCTTLSWFKSSVLVTVYRHTRSTSQYTNVRYENLLQRL